MAKPGSTPQDRSEFAAFLVGTRNKMWMSRAALAAKLKVPVKTYTNWEEARNMPRGDQPQLIRQTLEAMLAATELPWRSTG